MARPVCFDLIDKILGEVGKLKEEKKNTENMNKVIENIRVNLEYTIVYTYKDGNGGETPYFLYEFGCFYTEVGSESEDDY
tara:strand:- start:2179 stop:2418 length:240 start_codon:yes stop_codon:yes gene_type:complete